MKISRSLIIMAAVACSGIAAMPVHAQTCRVWCGLSKGVATYKEVYEYDYVSEKPQYPGGRAAMANYIASQRRYPAAAYRKGIQGRVTVSFVVNPDGRISNVSVLRGIEESLNGEAVRLISEMPQWKAGRLDGRCVPVRVIETVVFRL